MLTKSRNYNAIPLKLILVLQLLKPKIHWNLKVHMFMWKKNLKIWWYWCHTTTNPPILITYVKTQAKHWCYFMPVCSIVTVVKTITLRCRRRPDALLQEAEGRSAQFWSQNVPLILTKKMSTNTLCFWS